MTRPKPPAHLTLEMKKWWRHLVETFDFEPADLRVLQLACESWDRCQEARLILAREGLTYQDHKGNVRMRPETVIEKDSRASFARLVKQLGVDEADPPVPTPGLRPHRRTTL